VLPDWARHLATGLNDADAVWEFISEAFPLSLDMADAVGVFSTGAAATLGVAGGAFNLFTGYLGLQEQDYESNFGTAEILAESAIMLGGGLQVIGGVLILTGVGAPAGLALGAAGTIVSLGGTAVTVGLDVWDSWGRDQAGPIGEHAAEVFDAVASEIDEHWDSVDASGRRMVSDAASAANLAVGLAEDGAMRGAQEFIRATGDGRLASAASVGGAWKKVTGWS
jgi:hypothetical protein